MRENALQFLQQAAARLWPQAVDASTGELDPELIDAQFLRANFQPTDRYVTTPAGSVADRLSADESGFDNLKLAADWTRNGIAGGSVEAAVVSGIQAARAISGLPARVHGEGSWLVR